MPLDDGHGGRPFWLFLAHDAENLVEASQTPEEWDSKCRGIPTISNEKEKCWEDKRIVHERSATKEDGQNRRGPT